MALKSSLLARGGRLAARKAALGRESLIHGQPGASSGPAPVPWWANPRKLVNAAIELARKDKEAWRALRARLVVLAREDEAVRRELLAELKALGTGRRGAQKAPEWREHLLWDVVAMCKERGDSVEFALQLVSRNHPELFPQDLQAMKNLWSKVRAKRRAITKNRD